VTVVASLAGIMATVWYSRRNGNPRIPPAHLEDAPARKREVYIVCLLLAGLAAVVLRGYRLRR
jgi:hypothetical protein